MLNPTTARPIHPPRLKKNLRLCTVLCVALAVAGCGGSDDLLAEFASRPLVPAEKLAETEIWPHLNAEIKPGRNYVYCGTFQLAWNALEDDLLKEPARVDGNPPLAVELGKRAFDRSMIDEASYVAKAGRIGDRVLDAARAELAKKLPGRTWELPRSDAEYRPHYIVALAYLAKSFTFPEQFDRLPKPLEFSHGGRTTRVKAFGIKDIGKTAPRQQGLRRQLKVIDYRSSDDFVLQLLTSADDEIILAKLPPGKTLAETIGTVRDRIDHRKPAKEFAYLAEFVNMSEPVAIPLVVISVQREYDELVGRNLLNVRADDAATITRATQAIRFLMNEKGIELTSESIMEAKSGALPVPRKFVFDRPFLIMLSRPKAAAPYFAMWVETPEVLEKAK